MKKFRYTIFIICSIFFLFHIGCTLIFNFSTTPDNTLLQRVVRRYMLPIFSQNNKVFASNPPLSKQQLWVRYHYKGAGWTTWFNYGKRCLDKTYSNRFSIYSYQNRVHEYVLGQLYNSYSRIDPIQNDNSIHNSLMDDEACIMACRYFSDMVKQANYPSEYDSVQYKVLFVSPEKFSHKPSSEIKADTSVFRFPEMKVSPSSCSN